MWFSTIKNLTLKCFEQKSLQSQQFVNDSEPRFFMEEKSCW